MKEAERSVLGYLAAFTLGVVCMGVIALVLMRSRHTAPESESAPPGASPEQVTPQPVVAPRPQTFQRIPRSIPSPVAEPVPVEEPATATAAPAGENVESEPPQVVVVPVARPGPVRSESPAIYTRGGGRLSGKVMFAGSPPPEKKLPLFDAYCTAQAEKGLVPTTTRFYVQGKDRALADVVVSVVGMSRRAASYQRNLIVEQGCNFEPYITAASVGQKILVENRDRTMHSLRFESTNNGEIHRAFLPGGSSTFELKAPEDFIRIRCEVHPWEFTYVSVFDHPFFAVTDKNGDFVIDGIPSGRYTVQAHHRKAGIVTKEVVIDSHQDIDLQFVMEVPPKQTAAVQ